MDNSYFYSVIDTILEIKNLLPIIIIPVLISLKIMLGKKFNNWIFGILLSICLIYDIVVFIVLAQMSYAVTDNTLTIAQKINNVTVDILYKSLKYTNWITPILLIITSLVTIIYYKKTNSKEILQRYCINLLFLGLLFFIGYPIYFISFSEDVTNSDLYVTNFYANQDYTQSDNKVVIEKYEKASDMSIFPPIKGYMAYNASIALSREIDKSLNAYLKPVNLSNDVKNLFKEYIKYSKRNADIFGNDRYTNVYLQTLMWKFYDTAEAALKKIELTGKNITGLYVDLYIRKGDYQKALNYLNNDNGYYENSNHPEQKIYSKIRIYIGQKKYNEALTLLNVNRNVFAYKQYMDAVIYIDYKTGDIVNAYNQFENLKKYQEQQKSNTYLNKYTLDDYIKFLDSTTF